MNTRTLLGTACLIAATVMGAGVSAARAAEPEIPLTETGEKLLAHYSGILTVLKTEISSSVPVIDEGKRAAFLKAYADEAAAKSAKDAALGAAMRAGRSKDAAKKEAAGKALKEADAAFVQAQADTVAAARPILADVETFLTSDTLDARLVKCAVLANATPRGLATFAQQGKEQEALVEKLLADDGLMKQMLVAGGARAGRYGKAMQIYTDIQKASRRAGKGILQRLAVGTSLEQGSILLRKGQSPDFVRRCLNYEKAYLDGELDPAFRTMTTWECRFITNDPSTEEDLIWGREMMRNYRPDHIFNPDYRWRYARIVKTDVAYKRPEWTPESGNTKMQQLINGGGKCGPRAWFGRFSTRCFGIPTWGVRQRGHAAMSHWTPKGWTVCLGAHWRWNWWDGRRGEDFLLETQAREYPKDYMKVLRAQWVGDALGEKKADGMRIGTGGLWNALALCQKKAIAAEAKPVEVALTGEDLAEANVSTKAEKIMNAKITEADKKIVFGKDGVITIPAVACSKPKNMPRCSISSSPMPPMGRALLSITSFQDLRLTLTIFPVPRNSGNA